MRSVRSAAATSAYLFAAAETHPEHRPAWPNSSVTQLSQTPRSRDPRALRRGQALHSQSALKIQPKRRLRIASGELPITARTRLRQRDPCRDSSHGWIYECGPGRTRTDDIHGVNVSGDGTAPLARDGIVGILRFPNSVNAGKVGRFRRACVPDVYPDERLPPSLVSQVSRRDAPSTLG